MSYRVEYRMIVDGPWVGLGPKPWTSKTMALPTALYSTQEEADSIAAEAKASIEGEIAKLGPPFVAEVRVIESDSTARIVTEYQDAPMEATA